MLWAEFSNSWAEFSLAIRIDRIVCILKNTIWRFFFQMFCNFMMELHFCCKGGWISKCILNFVSSSKKWAVFDLCLILNWHTNFVILFNNRFLRERGMASNPKMEYQVFSLHFPKELSYGYLRFEGNWKIPLER